MDDLIAEFITETNESIAELDTEIVQLEQNPDDYDLMNNIFRLMHTIKGTCGFLGLGRLEKVAHSGENVLDKLRNKELQVTSEAVTLILESIDQIKEILEVLDETNKEPEGDDSALISKLDAFAEAGGKEEAAAALEASTDPDADEHGFTPVPVGDMGDAEVDEHGFTPVPVGDMGNSDEEVDEHGFAPVPAEVTAGAAEDEAEAQKEEKAKEVAVDEGLKAEATKAPAVKKPSSSGSIRVSLDVLENLMQLVSELVLTRNQLMQIMRNDSNLDGDFSTGLQRLSHITSELQEGVMQTRMQPIGSAWNKLPRIVRDLSMELDKKLDLKMIGEETELDRQLLELVRDPLTHMVRNSCDHGIGMPAERKAAGKPETGTITLSAFHEGGHIIIELKDDGKGIDPEIIKAKAIEKGVVSEEDAQHLSNKQILRFIFAAGFSTAEKVTSVSGRGVGMDVVRTNVEKMGGSIDLDSVLGEGSVFQIKIPLTLAIMPVLIMETAGEKFAIPQINILELLLTSGDTDNRIETVNDTPVLRSRGRLLPLVNLTETLGLDTEFDKESNKQFIVVCELGAMSFGLIVDKIFDTEEIVVKPVSAALKNITLYSGSTILGDGSVIMILDPNGLAQSINMNATSQQAEQKDSEMTDEDVPVTFLVFKSGDGSPKAVPLELVSRLEEIEPSTIEMAGNTQVVQYRGDLMRISRLNTEKADNESKGRKMQQVIVFSDSGKILGLAVDEIIDIVDQKLDISLDGAAGDYLGSMVISGKTTDIIDVSELFEASFSDWKNKVKIDQPEITNGNILLVEDSPFFRKLMVPILEARGYKVQTASNGLEGAKVLSKDQDFNLIITDIDMPEMNGFEFAEACLGDPNIKHIPIIALTGNLDSKTVAEAERIGISGHVSKSDRDKLFELVEHTLKQSQNKPAMEES